ncbi:hypothetical protein BZA70DRAFT_297249 [Myxozyma melibiosi]|uniref:Uncharacterized protein n=1 Tax=Myxozyma melibiosi TaxID=54550 RepID=A0ABR1EZQ3_9ASCO
MASTEVKAEESPVAITAHDVKTEDPEKPSLSEADLKQLRTAVTSKTAWLQQVGDILLDCSQTFFAEEAKLINWANYPQWLDLVITRASGLDGLFGAYLRDGLSAIPSFFSLDRCCFIIVDDTVTTEAKGFLYGERVFTYPHRGAFLFMQELYSSPSLYQIVTYISERISNSPSTNAFDNGRLVRSLRYFVFSRPEMEADKIMYLCLFPPDVVHRVFKHPDYSVDMPVGNLDALVRRIAG